MSEYLAKAAENMGMPESLVMRSAEAKAKAQGVTVDDLLREWAGGEAASAGTSASASTSTSDDSAAAPEAPAVAEAEAVADAGEPEVVVGPPRKHVIAKKDPDGAPVLVAGRQGHLGMIAAIIAVLVSGAFLAALLPTQAARQDVNAAIGSQPDYSDQAITGRGVYLAEGCWTCHTMVVRATATDHGLGKVTTPKDVAPMAGESLGSRRIGPDLAHVGSRLDATFIYNYLGNPHSVGDGARHPSYAYLTDDEIGALTAFLTETK